MTIAPIVMAQSTMARPTVQSLEVANESAGTRQPLNTQEIRLSVKDQPVRDVLRTLSRQSGRQIIFDNTLPQISRQITITIREQDIVSAVMSVLKGTGLVASVAQDGQTIVVSAQPKPMVSKDSIPATSRVIGIVTDSATGQPIAGATISISGTKITTLSNDKGLFVLTGVSEGEQIVMVKLFGYRSTSRSLVVTGKDIPQLKIQLAPTATQLSGIVTTATGMQRRAEIGNDVPVLNVDSIMRFAPVTSVTELLATRVPGVHAPLISGEPGASRQLRIRGANSINGSNDPVIYLDGVQIYSQQVAQPRAGNSENITGQDAITLSPLDQIDLNSLEKVEVFKGPSAVAMFGSHAANGVIVLTSKKGRPGQSPQWSMMGQWGVEYIPGVWPTNYYAWGRFTTDGRPTRCALASRAINRCVVDSVTTYQILNDPETSVLGRGNTQNYTVGVTGGSNDLRYSVTGSTQRTLGLVKLPTSDRALLQQKGLLIPSDISRPQANTLTSGTARIDANMGLNVVTLTTSLAQQNRRSTPLSKAVDVASFFAPRVDSFDASGNLIELGSALLPAIPDFRRKTSWQDVRSRSSLGIQRNFYNTVNVTGSGGIDFTSKTTAMLLGRDECYRAIAGTCDMEGSASSQQTGINQQSLGLKAGTNAIPLQRFLTTTLSTGIDYLRERRDDYRVLGTGLPFGATTVTDAAFSRQGVLQDDRITVGMYAGIRFGLFDQLYIPFEIRQDAGSALGSREQPTFPRLSFSYLASESEAFRRLPFAKYVGDLRLRTAYGRAGTQPAPGANTRTYTMTTNLVEQTTANVVNIAAVGNTALVPERSEEIELGFDLDMLDNRLRLTATWYNGFTKDLLVSELLPPSLGGGSQWMNLGDVRSKGREFTLELIPVNTRAIVWSSTVSYEYRRQTLKRLGLTGESKGILERRTASLIDDRHVVGYPLRGLWARPLRAYADIDGDGNILEDEVQFGDSMVYVGSPDPKFTSNIDQSLTFFKRITANLNATYTSGFTKQTRTVNNLTYSSAQNDPNAPLSEQAYVLYSALASVQTLTSFTINSMSIGWTVPNQFTQRILGKRSTTLTLFGKNLGLWTNYRNKDPNVGGTSSMPAGVLPTPRTWQLTARIQ